MKTTSYFLRTREREDRKKIKLEWILSVMENPDRKLIQQDGRIRLWKQIKEAENKALRVVLLEDEETIHNAFFDGGYKEKTCK